ncbi:hypothetical protein SAMN04487996_1139 [Dyadobacter soli]|uniref:Outer membrane protein beta-barrel domain-containing protein n=1 Tax=Dyadobacter soli TaxID=659014 RepID=A0A1G7PHN4_9BACT|nr:hypothetical protein [Dyadobacter soli]SDF85614.1 hypothetical protein SAMN04487996_1139 [Dyadobacter soli]
MRHLYGFIIAILPVFAYGQDVAFKKQSHNPWKFGVFAGRPVAGKIYDSGKMKSASGLSAGLDLGYYFEARKCGPSLHFQPGFIAFKKTEIDGVENSSYYIESKWKWEAVHLPLTFRYTLPTGTVRPFVEVGMNFRLRTAYSFRRSGTICGFISCNAVDGGADIQNVARKDKLGILAGVGVEVDAGKITIPLSVRLVDSFLQPKDSGDQGPTPTYSNLRTKFIQVTAGFSL